MAFLRFTVVGLALALAVVSGAQAASVAVIDPDGTAAGSGSITVGSLDWNVGNSIIQNIESGTSQVYAHSSLANFLNTTNTPIGGTGLNTSFEWTYTLGVNTTVVQSPNIPGIGVVTGLTVAPGGENFFRIYYDPSQDANQLAGTGFNNGTLILTGHFTSGSENFTAHDNALHVDADLNGIDDVTGLPIPLDEHLANDYPTINSIVGSGGGSLLIVIDSFDPNFFKDPPHIITLTYATANNLNYTETDPSALFDTSAGGTTAGATTASVGTCNGCTQETAPNVVIQVDASSAFQTVAVPLPGTLMLIGSGLSVLAGLAATRRRKA